MGYALFAQRKIVLTGQLNSAQIQQTQRSDEQYKLATQNLSLSQQMTSLTASQANELAVLYGQLAAVGENATFKDANGNALEGDALQAAMAEYNKERDEINDKINQKQQENQRELDVINRKIYLIGVKEASVEMEVKRLDTQVTALQQQLEAVQEAEGKAIQNATPKFKGVA